MTAEHTSTSNAGPAERQSTPPPSGQSFAEWLEPRLGMLKSALTERAFVCFLAGRDYLEKLHRVRQNEPHGVLHTLFSDYFFLQYLPDELHRFVRSLLFHTPSLDAAVRTREERDLAIVPFLVLFRAQLQPIDVRRRLQELLGPSGEIELGRRDAGGVLRVQEQYELYGQIVVESVLEEPLIRSRIESDYHFALLAIDAVYYAFREWHRGGAEDLDTSRFRFATYLAKRTQSSDGDRLIADEKVSLPEGDLRLLRSAMSAVVDRLADPTILHAALVNAEGTIAAWLVDRCCAEARTTNVLASALSNIEGLRAAKVVIGLLPRAKREALLEPIPNKPEHYRFRVDSYGRSLAAPDTLERLASLCTDVEQLLAVDAEMKALAGVSVDALRETYGLFQVPNVTWAALVSAHRALRTAIDSGSSYPAIEEDARILDSYVTELEAALPTIDRAVSLAHDVRGTRQFSTALGAIAEQLKLKTRSVADRRAVLEDTWRGVREAIGLKETALPPPALSELAHITMRFVWLATDHGAPLDATVVEHEYWRTWEQRIAARVMGRSTSTSTSWPEIARSIAKDRKATLLDEAWETNIASAWTQILLSAATGTLARDGEQYPLWAAAAALGVLGLAPLAIAWGRQHEPPLMAHWTTILSDARSLPLALVVATERGSPVWSWRASGIYGVMVVTEQDVAVLDGALEAAWHPLTERHAKALEAPLLLVEAPPGRAADVSSVSIFDAVAVGRWSEIWRRARWAWLVPAEPQPKAPRSNRIVVGANSVEEAAAQIFNRPAAP